LEDLCQWREPKGNVHWIAMEVSLGAEALKLNRDRL